MKNKLRVSSAIAKELGIFGFYYWVKTGEEWNFKGNLKPFLELHGLMIRKIELKPHLNLAII